MAMIVLSSPATLTGAEEKKTEPSRFNEDFSSVTVDDRHHGPDWGRRKGGWVDTNFTDWHELFRRIFDLMNALSTIPTGLCPICVLILVKPHTEKCYFI